MIKARKIGLYAASVATMVGMTALVALATTTLSDESTATTGTRATTDTGSFQTVAGDLTYEGAAGGTSYYHAGVMGNFLGDNLTNATSALHAGVIGSYNVTTDDDNTGGSAGVIGEVGDLADAAAYGVLAVLGGDGGQMNPQAAYGVQYFNSTAASNFAYGLDLFHAETADYVGSAVEFGTADIRFQNGATLDEGTDGTLTLTDATWAEVGAETTRATGATGSFQTVWGDLTYEGAAGGTSAYHAGVMGNFLGANLTNTNTVNHAGVIGKYSVTTGDTVDGPKAGVVGEAETSVADAAVMAVLGGDTGTVTPGAAFGVQYLNSTAASKFDYGLDLFRDGGTTDYGDAADVDFGTADIRLSSQASIFTGAGAPTGDCTRGSIYLRTDSADEDTVLYTCAVANTWDAADL
ncbi:MAG: hypothetical protein HYS89_01635 [Candidatus Colwellbacteria bacterium]|nr:hypothetical protein [Candidatus Colwellbacteria bacterium]